MKGIEIRGDSIRIVFMFMGVRCRETLKLRPTPSNIKYATRLRETILHEIEKGLFDYAKHFPESSRAKFSGPAATTTVGEMMVSWLKSLEKEAETSTFRNYKNDTNNILTPKFGHYTLKEFKKFLVSDWIDDLDLSVKRLNNLLIPVRGALALAVEKELLESSPLEGYKIKRKGMTAQADDIDPFTPEEQSKILSKMNGQIYNFVLFNLWTGLRTSEMFALAWEDIDFEKGVAYIRRARVGKIWKGPKTKAGNREIKLLSPALQALTDQRKHTEMMGSLTVDIARKSAEIRPVFRNPRTNDPWETDSQFRKVWRPMVRQAKVRYRYPYQMRHTYASTMLSAGENPMWVARQMGHKDWAMIIRVYGKWIPEVDPYAGEKAEKVFAKMPQTSPREIVSK